MWIFDCSHTVSGGKKKAVFPPLNYFGTSKKGISKAVLKEAFQDVTDYFNNS